MDDRDSHSEPGHRQTSCRCSICSRLPIDIGSLTQWLLRTDLSQSPDQQMEPHYCSSCGLREQPEKPGSLTQWIFKFHTCSCDRKKLSTTATTTETDHQPENKPVPRRDESGSRHISFVPEAPEGFPLERFEPLAEVASGASGTIYRALDRLLQKTVAIKLIHSGDEQQFVDFQNEAKAISLLTHPHIVQVLDFSVSKSDTPYMVMEFVDGESLEDYLRQRRTLTIDEAVEIISQVADAVRHAHEKGVLHRDLKPGNILLEEIDDQGLRAKVVDFGLARIKEETLVPTETGDRVIVGTPTYMSPDTVRGLEFDQGSDVYSLGTILFECIAGRPPFESDNPLELIAIKAREEPPTLESTEYISDDLDKIVAKAIARDAKRRYQNMNELLAALRALQTPLFAGEAESEKRSASDTATTKATDKQPGPVSRRIVIATIAFLGIALLLCSSSLYRMWTDSRLQSENKIKKPDMPYKLFIEPDNFMEIAVEDESLLVSTATNVTNGHLEDLKNRKRVKALAIKMCYITSKGISVLRYKYINTLVLSECRLSDGALASIGSLASLTGLYLPRVNLRQRSLEALGNIEFMTKLDLSSTGVTTDQLRFLPGYEHLKILNISDNDLGDDALAVISQVDSLKKLVLSDNQFSEAGLLLLKRLKNLENIYAARCTGISKASLTRLRARMPDVSIHLADDESDPIFQALNFF